MLAKLRRPPKSCGTPASVWTAAQSSPARTTNGTRPWRTPLRPVGPPRLEAARLSHSARGILGRWPSRWRTRRSNRSSEVTPHPRWGDGCCTPCRTVRTQRSQMACGYWARPCQSVDAADRGGCRQEPDLALGAASPLDGINPYTRHAVYSKMAACSAPDRSEVAS